MESRHPIANKENRDLINEYRGQVNIARMEIFIAKIMLFGSWLRNTSAPIWSSPVTKIVSPVFAIAGSVLSAIFSWKEFHKSRQKHALASAIVETAAGAAMVIAALAILASIAALSFVAPILFVAAVALKSLFSFGSAIYFMVEAHRAKTAGNEAARAVNLSKAKHAAVDGLVHAAVAGAAVVLMVFAAPLVQTIALSIAVAASAIGLIHGIVKTFTTRKNTKQESAAMSHDDAFTRSTHNLVGKEFRHKAANVCQEAHQKVQGAPAYQQLLSESENRSENPSAPANDAGIPHATRNLALY